MSEKATILYVEDDETLSFVTKDNLELNGYNVVHFADGKSALDHFTKYNFDLCILDVMLPEMDGYTLASNIRKSDIETPILFLTAKSLKEDRIHGLKLGADDYITKPFSTRELAARIKAVLRRRSPESADDVVEISELRLDPVTHRVTVNDHEVILGPTEFRLLYFLMTHTERVHSRSQLLDGVWGDHVFVEDRTVDVHIRRLRKILEPVGKDGLVQTVRGTGYRLSVGRA